MRALIFAPTLSICVASCGNLNSIHHTFRAEDGTSISVDAKQRAIFTLEKGRDKVGDNNWRVICAEPSPDALTAISSSAAIDAEVAGKALGLALGANESAASIGLRTQTIQLLRDGMYRLCEGYASSALDEIAFARLQRRYQNVMLGLLAVEQLTGAVVANQAAIQSSVTAQLGAGLKDVSEAIIEAREQERLASVALEEAKTQQTVLTKNHAAAKSAYDVALKASPDGSSDDSKKTKAALDSAENALKNGDQTVQQRTARHTILKNELTSLESIRENLRRAASELSSTIRFSTPTVSKINASPDISAEKVTSAVKEIVTQIVNHDYTRETCLDTLLSRNSQKIISEKGDSRLLEIALRYCAAALLTDSENNSIRQSSTNAAKDTASAGAAKKLQDAIDAISDKGTLTNPASDDNPTKDAGKGGASGNKAQEGQRSEDK